jgi:hypothetical protein
MGTSELRKLPSGWQWIGPAEPFIDWLDPDVFLMYPFAAGHVLPHGSEDSTWILHAQYVCPIGVNADDLGEFWPGQGFSPRPPHGWRRVLWKDVAEAKGVALRGPLSERGEAPPCDGWEAVIDGPLFEAATEDAFVVPAEGSMSQLELEKLIPILAAQTTTTRMHGVLSYMDSSGYLAVPGDPEGIRYALSFELPGMVSNLLTVSDPNDRVTPELWWPENRAWLVWSDYDLMGSKIFGSRALIQQVREHPDIETLDWFPDSAH